VPYYILSNANNKKIIANEKITPIYIFSLSEVDLIYSLSWLYTSGD
jgi:hypothetical protein